MKYILDYIKQCLYLKIVEGTTIEYEEEFASDNIPIGYRLILNGKDINLVVWYADYNKWLEEKYESLKKFE